MKTRSGARKLDKSISKAVDWLEANQTEEGYWAGFLQTNSTMEAEWVLAMHFLGITDDPKYDSVVRCILNMQREDGSWEVYHEAPAGDLSATVECYAALRTAGYPADHEALVRARRFIEGRGGLGGVRVFTKMWLALIGEWPWEGTPTLPPELIFFPNWAPFNIYQFSSWARATIVPLCILSARRPVRPLAPERRMDELFPGGRHRQDIRLPRKGPWLSLPSFFLFTDRLLEKYCHLPIQPGREVAIKQCLEWIIRHQEADGCWAGIQPPWIYSLMALHTEGYPLDHPVMAKGIRCFDAPWAFETEKGTYLQACTSPVWDTLLTELAMLDCGFDCENSEMLKRSVDWVLEEQILARGDWEMCAPSAIPGGWAFEYENDWYPDVDDTAVGLMVLAHLRETYPDRARIDAALARALAFTLGLQCSNGGWGAFDKDNDKQWVGLIPFCDFGETLDPPSVDVTAHVVEALGILGRDLTDPVVARAVEYLRREQEPDGSWFGRWGVNYVYGTGAVVPALAAVGENMQANYVRRACDWLVAHQNEDGGWGETCASYMDDSLRGVGPSTASQTAWALLALVAQGGSEYRESLERGLDYLTSTQTKAGSWDEPYFTGTGFPGYGLGARTDVTVAGNTLPQGKELGRGFMLRYHMYRHYFPMMALGRARRLLIAEP
ncbi:MAG: squalene--hopene cyclase [Vulcanimicrobiota bacterium]